MVASLEVEKNDDSTPSAEEPHASNEASIHDQENLINRYTKALERVSQFLKVYFKGAVIGVRTYESSSDVDYEKYIESLDSLWKVLYDYESKYQDGRIVEQDNKGRVLKEEYKFTKPNVREIILGKELEYDPNSGTLNIPIGTTEDEIKKIIGYPETNSLVGETGVPEESVEENALESVAPEEVQENKSGFETIHGLSVYTTEYTAKNSSAEELENVKIEINGDLEALNEDELNLLKSNDIKIFIKDSSVLFPIFRGESKVLEVGIGEVGPHILYAIRNTVIPSIKNVPEVVPEPEPTPAPASELGTPVPVPVPEPEPEPVPVIQMENQEEAPTSLEAAREKYSRILEQTRNKSKTVESAINLNLEEAEAEYYKELEIEAGKVRERIYTELDANRVDSDPYNIMAAAVSTKRQIAEEIIEKENKELSSVRMESRKSEGKLEKFKEYLQKGLKWYTGTNKWVRLGVTTGLFGVAGVASGMGVAAVAGYGAYRFGRGAASLAVVGGVNKLMQNSKGLSIEEVEKTEREKKKTLKEDYSELDIKGAMKGYQKIEEESEKEKKRRAFTKGAIALGTGVATGFLASATVGEFSTGGAGKTVLEGKGTKVTVAETIAKAQTPKIETPAVFSDPSVLKVKLEIGDGPWKAIEKILNKSEEFKSLGAGEKDNITANLVDVVMKDPEKYGVDPNGTLKVGDELDFTKLFEDKEKINSIFKNAAKLSIEQKTTIPEYRIKISNWLNKHPDEPLTPEKVSEILSEKATPEVPIAEKITPIQSVISDQLSQIKEPEIVAGGTTPEIDVDSPEKHMTPVEHTQVAKNVPSRAELESQIIDAKYRVMEGVDQKTGTPVGRPELHDQIAEAKRTPIESQAKPSIPEVKSMIGDVKDSLELKQAFNEGLDEYYGKSRLFFKTRGADSSEWKFMSGLPAKKVIGYITRDSSESNLPPNIIQDISNTKSHMKMLNHIVKDLMPAAGKDFVPYDNENMKDFLGRLSGFLWKKQQDALSAGAQLPKAA